MKTTKKFLASSLGALTLLSTVGLNSSIFATGPASKSGLSTRAKVLLGLGCTIGVAGIVTALVLKSKSGNDSSNSDSPSGKLNVTTGIDEEPENLPDNENNGIKDREPENLPDNENNGIKDREPENSDDSWYLAGWTDNNEANEWKSAGWSDPNEANEWKSAGWSDPNEARTWRSVRWGDPRVKRVWNTPEYAREWKDAGWDNPREALLWCNEWSFLHGDYEGNRIPKLGPKLEKAAKKRWNMDNSQIAKEARKWYDIGWNDFHVAGNWFFSWKLGYIIHRWTLEVNLAQEAWEWYNAGWKEVKNGYACSADCYFLFGAMSDSVVIRRDNKSLSGPAAALRLFIENGNNAREARNECCMLVDQRVRLHSYGPWD